MSASMNAIRLTGHGGNEVVSLCTCPVPLRGPDEVRVAMRASTLNQVDLYMRNSGAGITHQLPQTMGIEGCGVVSDCSPQAGLQPGQRVVLYPGVTCVTCEFCARGDEVLCTRMSLLGEHRDGTWADRVCVPARNVLPAPEHLGDEEAAALAVTHLTAWRMLRTQARLKAGEWVLILGIGGGVSLAGLQLAKAMGARCIVTSRHAHKLAQARAHGADHAIDTSATQMLDEVMRITAGRGVDVVFENVGAAVWSQAMKCLVRSGRLVTCGATSGDQPPADLRRIFIRQLQILGSTLGNRQEMVDLLAFVSLHRIRPHIDRVFPRDRVHEALSCMAQGEQFGKLALRLDA